MLEVLFIPYDTLHFRLLTLQNRMASAPHPFNSKTNTPSGKCQNIGIFPGGETAIFDPYEHRKKMGDVDCPHCEHTQIAEFPLASFPPQRHCSKCGKTFKDPKCVSVPMADFYTNLVYVSAREWYKIRQFTCRESIVRKPRTFNK